MESRLGHREAELAGSGQSCGMLKSGSATNPDESQSSQERSVRKGSESSSAAGKYESIPFIDGRNSLVGTIGWHSSILKGSSTTMDWDPI